MKTKFFLSLLILMVITTFSSKAQTSYSCTYREYCKWNEQLGDYESECEGYQEASLFVLNANKTMITHTIQEMTTTYYVKKTEYRKDYNVTLYYVVSDTGHGYLFLLDPDNMEIRVLDEEDDYDVMTRFYVKAIF